jgi:hypothetical protein
MCIPSEWRTIARDKTSRVSDKNVHVQDAAIEVQVPTNKRTKSSRYTDAVQAYMPPGAYYDFYVHIMIFMCIL